MSTDAVAYAPSFPVAESPGIGLYAERGLHAALKAAYGARPGARVEAAVAGKVVDVVLPDELVEVQTRNLGAIAEKVLHLACVMPVRIVHPIVVETIVERLDPGDLSLVSSRRARTRRDFFSLFDELVRASIVIASPNVRFDVLLVRVRELRVRDGSGSWRRHGDRVLSRDLLEIVSTTSLDTRADWLALIPAALPEPYDSGMLGAALGIPAPRARKLLYAYARAGLLVQAGKTGNRKQYRGAGS
ncbi:MAG: hypothetical protein CVV51_03460 [Spirochaetae bacterium HGW-Spirochaetae-7]|jgi:hypothetical protein|nr:MAG: hypothetical protein CVV51_03460 [Spirochaetae bacterium HGW-Spirochaetae-7]